ncbi:MAG: NAD(P)H-hydrate dehydratase [Ruminococcus flavefaciens]|nr:NAD(P)H-hydrate dehydratase [Ruminococcus flavefaciens]MCM1229344.1 NAD(P)H-hydrate dehydratase [Ruminococcus flavefaciens]
MRIVTVKQMSAVEDMSEKLCVSKKTLMQNAGEKIACRIMEITASEQVKPEDTHIVFLAGGGNNGGDCFACANILVYRGYNITVVNLVKAPSTDLAKEYFSALPDKVNIITGYRSENVSTAVRASGFDYMTIQDKESISGKTDPALEKILISERERLAEIRNAVVSADILVDGVFGTGFKGELDKELMTIFSFGTGAYKIAVDIPSGGDASKGTVPTGIFKADETICLGCLKFGMTQYPLKKFCGNITIADICIPNGAYDVIEGKREYYRLERNSLAGFPPKRERDAHKGIFGTVLVISGSSSMRGAAAFAVLGALRSGAGIVRLASVEKCIDTVSVLAPEATFIELESDENGFMKFNADILSKALEKVSSVVIGSGMGVTEDTMEIVRFIVQNAEVPVIIDADGINCIAQDIEILMNRKSEVIITPHPGEMARLLKCDAKMINDNRIMVAEKYAEQYGIIVVLKGAGTIIADRHRTSANHTGNAGMSKGGSGDILSGIIGSTVAQNIPPYDAACAGVYMHGLAGDSACQKFGQEAMLPRDVVDCLSDAFRTLKEKLR